MALHALAYFVVANETRQRECCHFVLKDIYFLKMFTIITYIEKYSFKYIT